MHLPTTSRPTARALTAAAAALVAAAATLVPAGAQEPTTTTTTAAPTTTSTTSTAPPTTAPPSGPSTTAPGGTSTTTSPPAGDEGTTTTTFDPERELEPGEDVVADEDTPPPSEVPLSEDTVPPEAGEVVDGRAAERLIRRELSVARAEALASEADVDEAAAAVDQLTDRLVGLQQQLARLDVAQALAVQRLTEARERFEERVANAVVRGNAAELDTVLTSADANEIEIRKLFLRSVSEADVASVVELTAAKAVVDQGVLDALDDLAATRRALRSSRTALAEAIAERTERRFQLAVFAAGSEIVIRGFVFPVAAPYTFIDSWGFPRMTGTEYEHGHQGVDVMAPFGAPLFAVERGIITRVGVDVLGGQKLWLKGASGTYYYYAHLQAYAPGMVEGAVVGAGDVVGFVGDTGNARGGAPHLHFQVHPGGGAPVNPYGLLRVVADLSRRA